MLISFLCIDILYMFVYLSLCKVVSTLQLLEAEFSKLFAYMVHNSTVIHLLWNKLWTFEEGKNLHIFYTAQNSISHQLRHKKNNRLLKFCMGLDYSNLERVLFFTLCCWGAKLPAQVIGIKNRTLWLLLLYLFRYSGCCKYKSHQFQISLISSKISGYLIRIYTFSDRRTATTEKTDWQMNLWILINTTLSSCISHM